MIESEIIHGTARGWNHCRRTAAGPCDLCRAAHSGYQTSWRRRKYAERERVLHGTEVALFGHWAHNEPLCAPCRAWWFSYRRGLAAQVSAPPIEVYEQWLNSETEYFLQMISAAGRVQSGGTS